MKKDTIYIDTEDDITSIIEKVKSSNEKIIALVPPKRVGILQSAVNLKLLNKAAATADKKVVLISSSKSLASLAAGAQIPVAKNLQSRPELASLEAFNESEEEDVINGEDLPVGDLEKSAPNSSTSSDDDTIELPPDLDDPTVNEKPKKGLKKGGKKGQKVPNFDTFRKKLFLGGAIGALLIIFLVWATVFAPHATVNIKAKTDTVDVSLPITLKTDGTDDPKKATLQPISQQIKKTNSVEFQATGKKDVGTKASGSVTISNCASRNAITVPAGTAVSSNGLNFILNSDVVVPGGTSNLGDFGPCNRPGTQTGSATAQDIGEQYNIGAGNDFTVAGQSSQVYAENKSAFSGGSKQQVTVISDADIAAATEKIKAQDQNAVKTELTSKFNKKTDFVMNETFTAVAGSPNAAPAVGAQADRGQLTVETTYTLLALDRSDADLAITTHVKKEIKNKNNQIVYDTGLDEAQVKDFNAAANTLRLVTTAYIGPKIDTEKIKPQLVGKNYEEIRQIISKIDGVEDVDTIFSPFWVSSVSSENKIDIKFKITKDGSNQ